MLKRCLIVFLILLWAVFSLPVNAQVQSGDIVLNINPKYPKANEEVRASVSTFTTNLDNARISWMLNGETVLEGMGKKTFSFSAGDLELQTILEVKIETINGSVVNKKIIISPSEVDLLWQGYDVYTPPFYKGRSIPPVEGGVKVVAIPSNQSLAGFNYKWKRDYKNMPDASGYEKNYFIYNNSYLENKSSVEVTVSDLLGNGIGANKTTIDLGNPKIVFYQKDLILGTKWENALTNGFAINKDGATLIAEPYFFSKKDLRSSNYSFKWFLNGEESLIPDQKNFLSLKPLNEKPGNTAVKIIIKNTKTLFQTLEKTINVNF